MSRLPNRWLALGLPVVCAVPAWWFLHRTADELSAQANAKTKGPVSRAMAHVFPDSRPGATHAPPAAEKTRKKPEDLQTMGELVEWCGSEPDKDRWIANLVEIMEDAKGHRSEFASLWERWITGVRQLPVQSLFRRLVSVPSETLETMEKEARLGNGRPVLVELTRVSPEELEKTGVVDAPAELMAMNPLIGRLLFSAALGEGLSKGDYTLLERASLPPGFRRPVEFDVVDRLMNDPDKLTDFVLHHASTLTTKDPELKAAGDTAGFFYGPERRIDTILADPPSAGRDLLLNAALLSGETPPDQRENLLNAITDESLRKSTDLEAHARDARRRSLQSAAPARPASPSH